MTATPLSFSKDQISAYKSLIENAPSGWEGAIGDVKSAIPSLANINPLTEDAISNLSSSDAAKRLGQLQEYKKPFKICVKPLSPTVSKLLMGADPCRNNFFDNLDVDLKNFFNKVTALDGLTGDLSGEIKGVVGKIQAGATGFVGQLTNSLADGLNGWVQGGLAGISTFIFTLYAATQRPILAAIKKITQIQKSLLGPVKGVMDALGCLAEKVTSALFGTIEDMITGMVKNVLSVPTCAVQEFAGALAGKITSAMDSMVSPFLNPISKVFGGFGIGSIFKVKNFLSSGVDTIAKVSGLFKCGEGSKGCVSSGKYKLGGGLMPPRSNDQQQGLLDKALKLGGQMTDGVDKKIGDFENAYGQWNIFGTQVGTPDGLSPCNTSNMFNCGSPKIEFFGGDGSGAAGEVILGKFIDKLDKDDILNSFKRTASIAGVTITSPGQGYTEAPVIAFVDNCDQGYGAFGRAIIDKNQNSPTFGQVTDVVLISEGEGYPTEGSNGEKEFFIDKIIIDDPGSEYSQDDFIDDENLQLIVDEDGTISGVEVVNQVPYLVLPELFINSSTGVGAILRPVMNFERSTKEYRLLQVIDCLLPTENVQVIDTGEKVTVKRMVITRPDGTTSTLTTTVGDTGEFIQYVPTSETPPVVNQYSQDAFIAGKIAENQANVPQGYTTSNLSGSSIPAASNDSNFSNIVSGWSISIVTNTYVHPIDPRQ